MTSPVSPPVSPSVTGAPEPHARAAADVARALGVDPTTGLSDDEAGRRLVASGPNRLAAPPRPSRLARFAAQFRSLLILILVVAAGLAALVGETKDAIVVGVVLLLNATLGYVQEGRAQRSMDALSAMLTTRARVRRDGRLLEVDGTEVVPGDLVLLDAGDRVPADGRLWHATGLAADESSLTGEAVAADKAVAPVDADAPVADRDSMLWTNTTVVRGRAELLVTATGMATRVGQVARLLAEAAPRPTPLQEQIEALGRRLAVIAGVAVVAVLLLSLARGEAPGAAAMDAIALAIAAVPEGLPAVVTVTLAVGTAGMARRRAIVRRLSSVETLGSATVVCTDKTGTLTRNQMTARVLWHAGERFAVEGDGVAGGGRLVGLPAGGATVGFDAMVRANDADVRGGVVVGDPTEVALLVLAERAGADLAVLRSRPRVAELPFDAARKYMATLHADDAGDGGLLHVKGAPDVVLPRCGAVVGPNGIVSLDAAWRERILAATDELAGRGMRTLAVASRHLDVPLDADADVEALVEELVFASLVGIVDPPRPGVAEAVATAQRAGIAVKMITGDHPATATAIAAELGIPGRTVTGVELDRMDDDELEASVEDIGVCARVAPEHKVRIVRALQQRGHVTAMTGDGVNDAPALERADIGVAMGIAGTEVTKQAADVVLADDDFTTIVAAVERGRAIYDNIVAFVRFQLATNIGAILTILVGRLAGLPTVFTAVQLLWVNLIMDGPPALALGVDPAHPDTMRRPPRDRRTQILDRQRLGRLLLSGGVMAAGTLGVFGWTLRTSGDEAVAGTLAFTTFVLFQFGNALNARAERTTVFSRHTLRNRHLWVALAVVLALQVLAVQVPVVGQFVGTVPLTARAWAVAAAVATTVVIVEEVRKLLHRR
ncbi:cation-translocating P-type ATPase [Egicoccus halophilus]|uniref:ATPase n=1 Tax=Egicoccus halophilus TaxID=1670830 RepID=A0A8J3AA23_9ACTN|nr:HAD-IC family P-type ATPase [Egicoccus halophilus]GGI08152.1 ATPase [Egicoccus halophilus]